MSNSNIINEINHFKNSDLKLCLPYFDQLEFQSDGPCRKHLMYINNNINSLKYDFNGNVHSIFSLLDKYILINNDNIYENYSLRKKYIKLASSEDIEIIIKELYRLLKLMRNTVEHSPSKISKLKEGEVIEFFYSFKGTDFILRISEYGISLLYSMVIMISQEFSVYNNESRNFHIGILRYYYDNLKQIIDDSCIFKDDIPTKGLLKISNGLRLTCNRLLIKKPSSQFYKEHKLKIDRYARQGIEKSDYNLIIRENEYIVPDEALDNDGFIELVELEKWKCTTNTLL